MMCMSSLCVCVCVCVCVGASVYMHTHMFLLSFYVLTDEGFFPWMLFLY